MNRPAHTLVTLATAICLAGQAAQAQPSPATQPASQTALRMVFAPATHPAPLASEALAGKLSFSENDRQVLMTLRDDTRTIEEAAFYLMLSKVADLPDLNPREQLDLDSPSVSNLTRRPEAYRFQPVRLQVRVYTVTQLSADARHADRLFTPSVYWPASRPLYVIHAVSVDPKTRSSLPDQPVVIYSDTPPPNLPGDGLGDSGRVEYKDGQAPLYDVMAVFYKTIRNISRGSEDEPPQLLRYPVVLAWQWEDVYERPSLGPSGTYVMTGVLAMGLVLAAAVFFFLRKRTKAARASGQLWQNYRPLRDKDEDDADTPADEDETIDPNLAAAASDYRKQHHNPADVPETPKASPDTQENA